MTGMGGFRGVRWGVLCSTVGLLVVGCGAEPMGQATPQVPDTATDAAAAEADRPQLKGGLAAGLARPLAHTQRVIVPVIEAKFTPGSTQVAAGSGIPVPGRSDPFSPFAQVSTVRNPAAQAGNGTVTTPVPGVVPLPALLPVPQLPAGSLPALPTEPIPAQGTPVAPQRVAASPSATPPASAPPAAPASAPAQSPAPPSSASTPVQQLPAQQLADTVEVRGVVNLSTGIAAVVVLPQERTSRYVRVGDRLANGKVLVKHITVEAGKQPVVVLEEGGREYTKAIGV